MKKRTVGVSLFCICMIYFLWIMEKDLSVRTKTYKRKVKSEVRSTGIKGIIIDETMTRCRGTNMSFFTLRKAFAKTKPNGKNLTIESCLKLCYERSSHFAGITQSSSCYCQKTFKGFVTDDRCQAACSAETAAKEPSPRRILLFERIHCYNDITTQVSQEQFVGYIENLRKENAMEVFLPKATDTQCLLNCALQGKPLAIPHPESNVCICSNFSPLFENSEELKISQNYSARSGSSKVKIHPVYKTFVDDPHCGPKMFLSPLRRPITVLSGLPGSGNTWIRHLIESATGIYTGSAYNDTQLYNGGFIGELENPMSYRTVAVKDHFPSIKQRVEYTQAILVIRNIRHATLAEFTRMLSRNHTGSIDPENFKSQDFKNLVTKLRSQWKNLAKSLLRNMENVLVVYYEDVVQDPIKELRKIVKFLRVKDMDPAQLETRLMCTSLQLSGNFKRPPRNLPFELYDTEMENNFFGDVLELNEIMKAHYQPPLPESYFERMQHVGLSPQERVRHIKQ